MPFTLGEIVSNVINAINTDYELNKIVRFAEANYLGVSESQFKLSIENIETNIRWTNKNFEKLKQYLEQLF